MTNPHRWPAKPSNACREDVLHQRQLFGAYPVLSDWLSLITSAALQSTPRRKRALYRRGCCSFNHLISEAIEAAMRQIAGGIAFAHGCTINGDYKRVFVPLPNDPAATTYVGAQAKAVWGRKCQRWCHTHWRFWGFCAGLG
jgi:hypothetical protein